MVRTRRASIRAMNRLLLWDRISEYGVGVSI